MKIVEVEWRDSGSVDGVVWQFKDDWACEVHNCKTVGYLVEKTKDKIVVAQSQNDDQWGRLFAIPRENLVKLTVKA